MSSNAPASAQPRDSIQFGSNGSYGSNGIEQAAPLKVQLGEHLDGATRRSLQALQRSDTSMLDVAKRNAVPILLAVGGLAWMLTSLRGFRRR